MMLREEIQAIVEGLPAELAERKGIGKASRPPRPPRGIVSFTNSSCWEGKETNTKTHDLG
jgi:hypothetical protein